VVRACFAEYGGLASLHELTDHEVERVCELANRILDAYF
jgi:hypothetical protein